MKFQIIHMLHSFLVFQSFFAIKSNNNVNFPPNNLPISYYLFITDFTDKDSGSTKNLKQNYVVQDEIFDQQ